MKIPRWLRQFAGAELQVDHCAGRDYPENLREYALIIHCGGCMLTRGRCWPDPAGQGRKVPITNYGLSISF